MMTFPFFYYRRLKRCSYFSQAFYLFGLFSTLLFFVPFSQENDNSSLYANISLLSQFLFLSKGCQFGSILQAKYKLLPCLKPSQIYPNWQPCRMQQRTCPSFLPLLTPRGEARKRTRTLRWWQKNPPLERMLYMCLKGFSV